MRNLVWCSRRKARSAASPGGGAPPVGNDTQDERLAERRVRHSYRGRHGEAGVTDERALTSNGDTFAPPVLIMPVRRPVQCRRPSSSSHPASPLRSQPSASKILPGGAMVASHQRRAVHRDLAGRARWQARAGLGIDDRDLGAGHRAIAGRLALRGGPSVSSTDTMGKVFESRHEASMPRARPALGAQDVPREQPARELAHLAHELRVGPGALPEAQGGKRAAPARSTRASSSSARTIACTGSIPDQRIHPDRRAGGGHRHKGAFFDGILDGLSYDDDI